MKAQLAQSFDVAERRTYIGASEMAAVMGRDRYRTPLDVYNEKLGLAPGFEGNNHTERGNRLEAIAAEYYTEQTGVKLRRHTEPFIHRNLSYLQGHVDRLAVGEKRIVEIKCPSVAAFRRHQREGLPESYIIQAQALMHLSGYPSLTWVIFCADVWDAAIFDVEYDAHIAGQVMSSVNEFWREHVEKGVPPSADQEKAAVALPTVGGTVTPRQDERFLTAIESYWEVHRLEEDVKALKEGMKRDLADAVQGEFGVYEGGGSRFYYTMRDGRKTLDKKALAQDHPQIDLSKYEKAGSPFAEMRVYAVGEAA